MLVPPHAALAQARVRVASNHKVIEDGDIQELPGPDNLARDGHVLGRWGRVIAGMVVHEDESGGVAAYRLAEHLGDTDVTRGHGAVVERDGGDETVLGIEQQHTHLLGLQKAHLGQHEPGGITGAPHLWALLARFYQETCRQVQRIVEARDLPLCEAVPCAKGRGVSVPQRPKRAVVGEQTGGSRALKTDGAGQEGRRGVVHDRPWCRLCNQPVLTCADSYS